MIFFEIAYFIVLVRIVWSVYFVAFPTNLFIWNFRLGLSCTMCKPDKNNNPCRLDGRCSNWHPVPSARLSFHASSSGRRAYCYAELAVCSKPMAETISSTHRLTAPAHGGMARLSGPEWLAWIRSLMGQNQSCSHYLTRFQWKRQFIISALVTSVINHPSLLCRLVTRLNSHQ